MLFRDDTEIFIKRGTPFVQYVPFKRETQKLEVRDSTEQDTKKFINKEMLFLTKFLGSNQYNFLRKTSRKGNTYE